MECHIITIFPQIIDDYLSVSIMKRAQEKGLFRYFVYNLADWSVRNTRRVDDRPYGGWAGTILMVEPLYNLIDTIIQTCGNMEMIYFSPKGKLLTQQTIERLEKNAEKKYLLICWHYEGIDERILELFPIQEVSIGEYVLSGGEIASLVWMDALIRTIPGVIDATSLLEETFSPELEWMKEYPHYTRPESFLGKHVPKELLSGNHSAIDAWKKQHRRT